MIQQNEQKTKQVITTILRHKWIVLSVIILIILTLYAKMLPCIPTTRIDIAGKKLWVCIVSTPESQQNGLSFSNYLPKNMGMLFVFEKYGFHTFWMEDMNYNIDILWLDDDLTPLEVARDASPDSYPGTFTSRYVHKLVLETRPGVIEGEYAPVPLVDAR